MVKTLQKSSSPEPAGRFSRNLVCSIIIIIINSLFKEDDILSKYNYLSNIWSSATKRTNNMDRIVQYTCNENIILKEKV